MTTKWSSQPLAGSPQPGGALQGAPGEKYVVLLLYGKNSFGDKIYSYLKITLGALAEMKAAVKAGGGFNPSDFGTVIAAGKGEPSDEVRREVASTYQVLDNSKPAATASAEIPDAKKAWDEY